MVSNGLYIETESWCGSVAHCSCTGDLQSSSRGKPDRTRLFYSPLRHDSYLALKLQLRKMFFSLSD